MTSIHHFFQSETAETFNKAKGFGWLFVSAHQRMFVFICLCLLFLHHHLSHPSSSSSPSTPVCLAGGSDSQHPHCSSLLLPPLALSLFILFLPHSVSFFLFPLHRVGKRACISIYPIGDVMRGCSVVRCHSFCCMLRIQCPCHTP